MTIWNKTDSPGEEKKNLSAPFFQEVDMEFLIHELKSPLAVIETGMRTLLTKQEKFGALSPKQAKTLKRALRNSIKARKMIYGLLETGRSEARCFDCIHFDARETVLESLVESLETMPGEMFDEIQVLESPDELPDLLERGGIFISFGQDKLELFQDRIKLKQIIGNLIKNALSYKQQRLMIRVETRDGRLIVEVEDDGPGISPENHQAVFQRYTRIKSESFSERSGHGLGLACAYILTRRLGGELGIISQKGEGALFRLSLPMVMETEPKDKPEEENTTAMTNLKGKKILAVDDEVDILETIEDILDESILDFAKDYATASKKIKTRHYDLAILDIMGVNGLTLLDQCVEQGIPAVMLTAHAINPASLMESIRRGAISYLPKEALTDLDTLLAELLGAHNQGRPPWKLLFEKLGDYFNERFGPGWQKEDQAFWRDFTATWEVGRGIQKRLQADPRIRNKGI